MIIQSTKRPATSLRILCDILHPRGISPETCLAGTGIAVAELDNPAAEHSTEQEIRAIENAVAASGNMHGLGWQAGSKMHVNAFGIWGFAILTSPTLRAAIQTSLDYIQLSFVIAAMRLEEHGDRALLRFDMDGLPPSIHHFILERHVAIAANFISELLQADAAARYHHGRVEVSETDPDYCATLESISGFPALAGRSHQGLSFPAEILDRPLPKSDPVSLRFCLEQCKALTQAQENAPAPWSQKVRDVILENVEQERKIDEISSQLAVTERTLRRRLTDEGTNFRELYTDVRMALAHELLEAAGLNVETVAWRVGYAETASFTRAFSRKYGITPGELRRR